MRSTTQCIRSFYLTIVHIAIILLLPINSQDCKLNDSFALPIAMWIPQIAYDTNTSHIYFFAEGYIDDETRDGVHKYDIELNTWSYVTDHLPTYPFLSYTTNAVYVNIKNIVYFVGMIDIDNDKSNIFTTGSMYLYDLSRETWLDTSTINKPQLFALGCLEENGTHIFMVGGDDGETRTKLLQIYNTIDNIWTNEQISIIANGWSSQACKLVDAVTLYVFGGIVTWHLPVEQIQDIYKYDTISNQWSTVDALLPHAMEHIVAVYYDPFIYIIGGLNNEHTFYTIIEFNTNTETIGEIYNMTAKVKHFNAVIVKHKLFLFGGMYNNGTLTSNIEICDILPRAATTTTTSISTSVALTTEQFTTVLSTTEQSTSVALTTEQFTTALSTTEQSTSAATTVANSTFDSVTTAASIMDTKRDDSHTTDITHIASTTGVITTVPANEAQVIDITINNTLYDMNKDQEGSNVAPMSLEHIIIIILSLCIVVLMVVMVICGALFYYRNKNQSAVKQNAQQIDRVVSESTQRSAGVMANNVESDNNQVDDIRGEGAVLEEYQNVKHQITQIQYEFDNNDDDEVIDDNENVTEGAGHKQSVVAMNGMMEGREVDVVCENVTDGATNTQ